MEYAMIAICGNRAQVLSRQELTAGTVGAAVAFTFDAAWDGMDKTYVWRGSGVTVDDTAATGIIPAETLAQAGGSLLVGVYGVKGATATPTVWADLGRILPGAQPGGEAAAEPALPLWAQLSQRLTALEAGAPAPALPGVIAWPYAGCEYHEGFRLTADGAAVADENWAYAAFPVAGAKKLSTNLIHDCQGVFLDAAGQVLAFEAERSKDFEGPCAVTMTVPEGAVTACMNISKLAYHYGDKSHLAQYFALWTPESTLLGKRILCIGDSITYLDGKYGNGDGAPFVGWQAELRKRGALVDTFAWSGAILGYVEGNATIINDHIRYSVENGLLNVADYDIILLFGGTNDVYCGIGRDYFSANIAHTVDQLRAYNDRAQLYMMNILPSCGDDRRSAAAIEAYNGTLEATAAGLGVPVLDVNRGMGVNAFTFCQFFYDTVHPNSRGMARLGRLIADLLEGKTPEEKDYFTAAETAAIAAAAADRCLSLYTSARDLGVSNEAELTALVTALPEHSAAAFWLNDESFPAVFAELKSLGVAAPYGTLHLRKDHNVVSVRWECYESMLTLLNRYSGVNGVGWSGWKQLPLQEVEA